MWLKILGVLAVFGVIFARGANPFTGDLEHEGPAAASTASESQ